MIKPKTPRYYLAVGSAENLAPNGLKHSGLAGDVRLPFAAHDPAMADGGLGIPRINRREAPEHIPKPNFSFSGKPINHRLYYTGK